jgi:hypothetical protein
VSDLDASWHALWRSLRLAHRCGDLDTAAALGAELVRLQGLLRARTRRYWQRKRRTRWGEIGSGL